jgi:hypothetical protein
VKRFAWVFYTKRKEGEREWNIREIERECVREAEHCRKRKVASPIKLTIREKTFDENM